MKELKEGSSRVVLGAACERKLTKTKRSQVRPLAWAILFNDALVLVQGIVAQLVERPSLVQLYLLMWVQILTLR